MRVGTEHEVYNIRFAADGVWEMDEYTQEGRFRWTRFHVNAADPFCYPAQLASFVDYEE